jgi:retron-type reverse transcriptase
MNKKKSNLKATFLYNKKIANSFHNTDYYSSQQDHRKNVVNIDKTKRKITSIPYKKVDEIIERQIQAAKNEKFKIYRILANIRNKVIKCIEKDEPLPKHKDLLNLVANKYMLLLAYKTTRKNKGAMTIAHPLPESEMAKLNEEERNYIKKSYGLPEGLTWEILENLSYLIKTNNYQWGCSRRIWIDKPGTNKKRPITIPPYSDKLVQESLRMILEAIYEPVFQNMNCSFGFRASTGVHNAIYEIKLQNNTSSMTTAIEGDIENAYPSLNHKKLIEILNDRICDQKLLKFIKNRLKSLVFDTESKQYERISLGIPQGGIDSPYLWNIYLLGLDQFVQGEIKNYIETLNDKRLQSKRNQSRLKNQPMNPLYNKTKKLRDSKKKELKTILTNKTSKEEYFQKKKEVRILSHKLRQINYYDPGRKILRILYIRYADDFIILTNAPKDVNQKIKTNLSTWLHSERFLTLSEEKTKITDIRKEPAKFLGFELLNKPTRKVAKDSIGNTKRTTGWQMTISPDRQRLINRLFMKGYCDKNGFPREISVLSTLEAFTIIEKYKAIMEGLSNYYMEYISYSHTLTRWLYILRWSCIKTLAQKHHTNVSGVFKKYPNLRATVSVKVKDRKFTKSTKLYTETEVKRKASSQTDYYLVMFAQEKIRKKEFMFYPERSQKTNQRKGRTPRIMDQNFIENINWTAARTAANLDLPCLICGSQKSEMHHIKHVRKSNWSSINKNNFIEQLQYIRNRKQIPVCKKCHREIHEGKYNKKKLSHIIENQITDIRISAIEGYIINTEPYQGLPLIPDLINKGWIENKEF